MTAFRVCLLVEPQVHLVNASDTIEAIVDKLTDVSHKLRDAINDSHVGEDRKEQAREALQDFDAEVKAAADADRGVSAEITGSCSWSVPLPRLRSRRVGARLRPVSWSAHRDGSCTRSAGMTL